MTIAKHLSNRAVILLVTLALVIGFAAGAWAADERLTQADANLEKAHALVGAAIDVTGEMDEKTERTYERLLTKAQAEMDRARQHIADAIAVADGAP